MENIEFSSMEEMVDYLERNLEPRETVLFCGNSIEQGVAALSSFFHSADAVYYIVDQRDEATTNNYFPDVKTVPGREVPDSRDTPFLICVLRDSDNINNIRDNNRVMRHIKVDSYRVDGKGLVFMKCDNEPRIPVTKMMDYTVYIFEENDSLKIKLETSKKNQVFRQQLSN